MRPFLLGKAPEYSSFKTPAQIRLIRKAGLLVHGLFSSLSSLIGAGMTGLEIEELCLDYFDRHGLSSALRGFEGFPSGISVNVNETAAHGIPNDKKFRGGDLVTVDIAVRYRGFCSDTAWTFAVKPAPPELLGLLSAAWQSCSAAIAALGATRRLSRMGAAVQDCAGRHDATVLSQFGGHGLGRDLHEAPRFAYLDAEQGDDRVLPGMVLSVEPILGKGKGEVRRKDDLSWVTLDSSPVAQFEHNVALGLEGYEVLNLPAKDLLKKPMPPFY